jgi:glycine C-acetyltransferase
MYETLRPVLQQELAEIEKAGLYKKERIITSPQGAEITVQGGKEVINFCANNYLGLSGSPKVVEAAKKVMDTLRLVVRPFYLWHAGHT